MASSTSRRSAAKTAAAEQTPLVEISRRLSKRVSELRFAEPVAFTYNPLSYARAPHEAYLQRYGQGLKQVVLLGMNPGPFGMAQTGVPFGDVAMVREFLGIDAAVLRPKSEHPKRLITGFACERREISGFRLWGWARDRFGSAEAFCARFFVVNYCPLAFLEDSGKNRTPDRLSLQERAALFKACDEALGAVVDLLRPEHVVGIGAFAERRAREVLGDRVAVSSILHPSPASPIANRGWAEQIEAQLRASGINI
jgi:single-strand selective monofunctional uracil DNA glycosylase